MAVSTLVSLDLILLERRGLTSDPLRLSTYVESFNSHVTPQIFAWICSVNRRASDSFGARPRAPKSRRDAGGTRIAPGREYAHDPQVAQGGSDIRPNRCVYGPFRLTNYTYRSKFSPLQRASERSRSSVGGHHDRPLILESSPSCPRRQPLMNWHKEKPKWKLQ
jgi:hypothetical protein